VRLLDQVAQCRTPVILSAADGSGRTMEVTGPADYSRLIADCPIRYVLGDDLTETAARFAFSDGDRLASCMDLLRIPASPLWVEWNDDVHQRVLYECGSTMTPDAGTTGRRVGVLLTASPCGRSGVARTFWNDSSAEGSAEVVLSPLETHIDLRAPLAVGSDFDRAMHGGFVGVTDGLDPGVAALMECARFRFDERWLAYYKQSALRAHVRETVVRESLGAVVRDVPLLFALFLLLNARDATRSTRIDRSAINAKRGSHGRMALLDHIEVRASLDSLPPVSDEEASVHSRRPSRLHHVRGHLVRRGSNIFWRSPHVRGRMTLGAIRTRTVCLSFERGDARLRAADSVGRSSV
jgi:hypothetical protein